MQYRRLRWHSRRRQEALFSRLDLDVKRWLEVWSVELASFSFQALAADAYTPSAPLKWLRVNTDKGVLSFGAPPMHLESLGGLLAKAKTDDILHLGKRIGDRALKALVSQWTGIAVIDLDIQDGSSPSDQVFDARYGYEIFSLKGSGFLAYIILDPDMVDSLVPVPPKTLEALSARDSSLGNEKIELNVVLDLGTSKLADTIGLQIGDVLVSGTPLDSVFHLAHPDMRRLAKVSLVRKGSKKAVLFDTP